jgi:hypothetical protein
VGSLKILYVPHKLLSRLKSRFFSVLWAKSRQVNAYPVDVQDHVSLSQRTFPTSEPRVYYIFPTRVDPFFPSYHHRPFSHSANLYFTIVVPMAKTATGLCSFPSACYAIINPCFAHRRVNSKNHQSRYQERQRQDQGPQGGYVFLFLSAYIHFFHQWLILHAYR